MQFTIMLLIRHLIAVIILGANHHTFGILTVSVDLSLWSLVLLLSYIFRFISARFTCKCAENFVQVFLLRASGILLPFYVVMWSISAVQQAQKQYQLEQLHVSHYRHLIVSISFFFNKN